MHIQEGKPIKKASGRTCGPKHCYRGRKHQAKHAHEAEKQPNKGVGAYIVAFLFLILVIVLHDYAYMFFPLAVVSTVLSICAVCRRSTGYSVVAVIVSALATLITVTLTVLLAAEFIMGTSMVSFTIFS